MGGSRAPHLVQTTKWLTFVGGCNHPTNKSSEATLYPCPFATLTALAQTLDRSLQMGSNGDDPTNQLQKRRSMKAPRDCSAVHSANRPT